MKYLKTLLACAALILLFYALHFITRSPVFPLPHESVAYAAVHFGLLLPHLLSSFGRICVSNFLAGTAGIFIGVLCNKAKGGRTFSTIIETYAVIPAIVLFPIMAGYFGFREWVSVAAIFAVLICPYAKSARDALGDMDPALRIFEKSMGMTSKDRLIHFTVPAVLPALFRTAVRIQGLVFAMLFFIEGSAARLGIGGFIVDGWAMGDYIEMNAGIIAACLMSSLIYLALGLLKSFFCPHTLLRKEL